MGRLADRIDEAVEGHRGELRGLARAIYDSPELAFEERRAADGVAALLERHGATVERAVGGVPTAVRARFSRGEGQRVALLAEYDALPELGHACGHHLIAAASVGAWLALNDVADELCGTVELIGTPAEEGGGGKIALLDAGVFDGVDAAMMFHPFDRDVLLHPTLANCRLELSFVGKPSHAAIAPWDGASALTACMDTFRLIDGQRLHFRDGDRVHGFIREGGDAANIIVERAVAEISIRALESLELDRLRRIVERCARGAAMASDVELTREELQGYREMWNNEPLARAMGRHLAELGRTVRDTDARAGTGSTDAGNLSQALPVIHPWLAICDRDEAACHQRQFAVHSISERGLHTMMLAARCLARTAAEFVTDPSLRRQVREAFERRRDGAGT